MARIEGPKQTALSQVSSKSLAPIALKGASEPAAPPAARDPGASELTASKPKLQNLTGGFRAIVPASHRAPASAELMAQLNAGMRSAAPMPGTLQIKGGGSEAAAPKGKPRSADEIAKSLVGLNRSDAGEKIFELSNAEKKILLDAVKNGTVTSGPIVAAELTTLAGKDQIALLQKLPAKAIDGLKEVWRKGGIDSYPNVKAAVGIEMAARTDWGKDKANAGAVAALRKAASATPAAIAFGLDPDGKASAITVKGKITVKDALLDNPEATAAVLAHEGVHLHQGKNCCGDEGPSGVQAEVEGNLAGITVWDQLGNKTGEPAGLARDTLNSGSKKLKDGGAAGVKRWVTERYLENAKEKVAERKDSPKTYAKGDTLADWEAHAKKFEEALAKLKSPNTKD